MTSAERHSTDGELIQLLDGEADTVGPDVVAHVDSCRSCSARLAGLQHRDERLGEALRAVDLPTIDRARLVPASDRLARAHSRARQRALWSHSGLRAAAAVLLVAGVAAASPAGAWILDHVVGRRAAQVPNTTSAPIDGSPTQTTVQSAGSIVRFASDSDELLIRFEVRPSRGTLKVLGGSESRSSAQIVSGASGESFLVLPSELRVRNAAGSIADYEVILAPGVRRVRVQVGSAGDLATIDVSAGSERVVQLRAGERNP